jgi:hypothetical protein
MSKATQPAQTYPPVVFKEPHLGAAMQKSLRWPERAVHKRRSRARRSLWGSAKLRAAAFLLLPLLAAGSLVPSRALPGWSADAAGALTPSPAVTVSGNDMVIGALVGVPDPKTKLLTVFLADPARQGIYFTTANPVESPSIGLDKFTRLDVTLWQPSAVAQPAPLEFKEPTALAYRDGKLLVCDKQANTVYEVDIEQRKARVLLKPSEVRSPVSIAVSESGIIAIGQDAADNILLLRRGERIELPKSFDEPERLIFAGRDLLIVDADEGEMYWLRDVEGGNLESLKRQLPAGAGRKATEAALPLGITSRVRRITDFVVVGDIFVLADGSRLIAFTPHRGLYVEGGEGLTSQLSAIKHARLKEEQMTTALNRTPDSQLFDAVDSTIVGQSTASLGFRPLVFDGMNALAPSKLAAAGTVLIAGDERLQTVRLLNLVSATIRLTGTDIESEEALVSLYEDLQKGQALPLREYLAPQDNSSRSDRTLEQVLLEENIIITPYTSGGKARSAAPHAPAKPNARQRLAALVCTLNKGLCRGISHDLDAVLRRPIRQGSVVVLPNLFVSTINSQRVVELSGRPVREYLSAMYPTEEGARPTAEYLMRINPSYSRTLEHEMTKRGYTVASPDESSLAPGALVRVNNKQEVLTERLAGECVAAAGLRVGSRKAYFIPRIILSRGWADYLPREKGQPIRHGELAKMGVAKMEVRLFNLTEEALVADKNAARETGADQAQPGGQCNAPVPEGQYLITSALRISGASYRLLRADNTPVTFKAGDLARYGIRGVLSMSALKPVEAGGQGEAGEFIHLTGTEYVGYKAVTYKGWQTRNPATDGTALSGGGGAADEVATVQTDLGAVVPPEVIKLGGPQDVFSIREGAFVLPQVNWKADLILNVFNFALSPTLDLPPTQLLNTGNNLVRRSLSALVTKTDQKSVIDLETYGATFGAPAAAKTSPPRPTASVPAPGAQDAPTIAEVLRNREMLKRAINFPLEPDPERPRAQNRTIGVLEDHRATNTEHPDFVWLPEIDDFAPASDGISLFESAWLEGEPDSASLPKRKKFKNPDLRSPFTLAGEEITHSTHGTHIGGILSSSHRSSAPGLALGSQLLLIDVSNERSDNSVPTRITRASDTGEVMIFNISQVLPATEGLNNLSSWKGGFRNKWKPRLFILAASNDGKNFYYADHGVPTDFPHSIAGDFDNTLTVSSTDLSKRPLTKKEVVVKQGVQIERIVGDGANYGKNYVDILAPGKGIFSAAAERAYSPGDGTSLAAPQVAAAAVLLQTHQLSAKQTKARLIYTTDWDASYENLVWGGFLNVGRASWEIGKDLYYVKTDGRITPGRTYDIKDSHTTEVTIISPETAYFYDPTAEDAPMDPSIPQKIPLNKILRIERLGEAAVFRLIYRDDDNRLRIILNATLGGEIKYRNCDEWVEAEQKFARGHCGKGKIETLSVRNIQDYVAATAKLGDEAQLGFGKRVR